MLISKKIEFNEREDLGVLYYAIMDLLDLHGDHFNQHEIHTVMFLFLKHLSENNESFNYVNSYFYIEKNSAGQNFLEYFYDMHCLIYLEAFELISLDVYTINFIRQSINEQWVQQHKMYIAFNTWLENQNPRNLNLPTDFDCEYLILDGPRAFDFYTL